MTWTTPITFVALDTLEAAQLNAMQDNLNYLKNMPAEIDELTSGSANGTTTSTTFTAIDGTNLSITLTTKENGDILVGFSGVFNASAGYIMLTLEVDGVDVGPTDGLASMATGQVDTMSFVYLVTGLTAGSHTIKPKWKVTTGTGTIYIYTSSTAGTRTQATFWAREV